MPPDADPRDPVLDVQRVIELTRRHVPSARAVTDVDETGGEARAYAVDADLIFKTQRPHRVRPRTSLEKEMFHLQQLARCAPEVSVPRVLGYGHEDDVEYILMTRMPGVAMRKLELEGAAREHVLNELGSLLRRMHALPLEPLRNSGLFPGDGDPSETQARLERNLEHALATANGLRDSWTLDLTPEQVATRISHGDLSVDAVPVALHSNPGTEHVFVNAETLRLTGIIDFGDAYISHPAFDMRRWGNPPDRRALIDGYTAEGPVSASFHSVWRLISATALMLDFAERPRRRTQALEDLKLLLAEG